MGRIQVFVDNILKKGLSYNNEYSFWFQSGTDTKSEVGNIYKRLTDLGFAKISESPSIIGSDYGDQPGIKLNILCEEISLPGVSTATGQARGIYQGVDFKYAHTKIYNDLSISFICDREYTPLRFFEQWFHYVYDGDGNGPNDSYRSYTTKLYYDYCMNMTIVKDEDKNRPELSRTDNRTSRSAEYSLINVFPTSISSIPLNTGASQVVRFTVNLSYERWSMKVNDPTQYYSSNSKLLSGGEPTP
jgi:hypothetical protein